MNILVLFFVIGEIAVCESEIEDEFEKDLFYMKNFSIPESISAIVSQNWTENPECLIELNQIRKGLDNHEEWAIRGK